MLKVTAFGVFVLVLLAMAEGNLKEPRRNKLVQLLKKTVARMGERDNGTKKRPCEGNGEQNRPDSDMQFDIDSLQYYFTLPFSNFMLETSLNQMMSPIPSTAQLTDHFSLNESLVTQVQEIFTTMSPLGMNPSSLAAAMAMETVPIIFAGRMLCPSTVLNQFMMRLWDRQYHEFMMDSKVYMQFNQTAVAVFPSFESMPEELNTFVLAIIGEMNGVLFNYTNIITLALELSDVARVSHRLYDNFYNMKAGNIPTPFNTVIRNSIKEADVRCHAGNELFGQHKMTTSSFMNEWEYMETEEVCQYIGEFVYSYLAYKVQQMPFMDATKLDESFQWENLFPLCSWIRSLVHESIIPGFKDYQTIVNQMDTSQFLESFDFLGDTELTVLKEVLFSLGWPRAAETRSTEPTVSPTMDSTEDGNGNEMRTSLSSRKLKRVALKHKFGRTFKRNPFLRRGKW